MNLAARARAQAQEKWPGATVHTRGRKFIRHQHPTQAGRFMLDTQIGPMHYGPSDDQEIDTAWVPSGGVWDYEVTKNNFHCFVRDSVPVSYRYLDIATNEEVTLEVDAIEWVNEVATRENVTAFGQVTPTINDDRITWAGIATGWDVSVHAQTARLAKKIAIDTLANLGSPTIGGTIDFSMSFRLQMSNGLEAYIDGVLWNKNTDETTSNNIEFRAGGVPVFWFKRPWAADSDSEQFNGSMAVRKTGANLYVEVRIPWTWLQAAMFPIEIDPTVEPQISADNDDAFSGSGTTNADLAALEHFWGVEVRTNQPQRSVGNRFTLAVPKSATIDTAYFLVARSSGGNTTTAPVKITADDVDDAPEWATGSPVVAQVTSTTANVDINYEKDFALDTFERLADDATDEIKTVVKEIVDRASWVSGNHIRFLAEGLYSGVASDYLVCVVHGYTSSTTLCAKLHVEYTSGISPDVDRGIGRGIMRGVLRGV